MSRKTSDHREKQPAVITEAPRAHQTAIGGLTPPDHLSGEALGEWARVVSILFARGVLDQLDASALADYAECFGRLRECEREITERGLLVEGRDGNLVKNPAITAAKGYRDAMARWARLFGMTVGSRKQAGMKSEGQKAPNRFSELAAGRQLRRMK